MNLLAFDTSTELMSVAVSRSVDGQPQQWLHRGAGGAQASSGLIACILGLLQQAELRLDALDAICFGSGPGSFTGLRTACSVAQGLAFGANVPVLPVDSLLAVAEDARFSALASQPDGRVVALLDARMEEMYAASYAFDGLLWRELHASCLLRPQELVAQLAANPVAGLAPLVLAGNVFDVYADRLPDLPLQRVAALPGAEAMLRLAPQLLAAGKAVPAEQALPSYVRDKVAKTTLERAAEKAAQGAQ